MLRAKVYEIQWGGSIMPYVRLFENEAAIQVFKDETGFKVEVVDSSNEPSKPKFVTRTETTAIGSYHSKPFGLQWIEKECSYEVDGDFTDEERAEIAVAFEITSVLK